MKFTKIGKALLTGAISAGVVLSLSSCTQDYTVGYLYVTETPTAAVSGSGKITGFAIDHNTGNLHQISGLPVASGGANPVRAALMPGGRFLFVLNRGANSAGGSDCTSSDPCQNSGITVFSVGGNGSLFQQGDVYSTYGLNPFRMFVDSTGSYLYVLNHDAYGTTTSTAISSNDSSNPNTYCSGMFGTNNCGSISAFAIDSATGYLTPIRNVGASSTDTVMYFPVPANPVDFVAAAGYLLTLNGTSTYTDYESVYPYADGQYVYPYIISSSSSASCGLLCTGPSLSNLTPLAAGTAINYANGYVYVLDNEASSASGYYSLIYPYTVSSGSLQSYGDAVYETGNPNVSDPVALLVESGAKWAYVANYGSVDSNYGASWIQGYTIDSSTKKLTTLSGTPWGTGSGPVCLVEDPSNQFLYTANSISNNVTGRTINQITGGLDSATGSATLEGPASWCLIDGRTN